MLSAIGRIVGSFLSWWIGELRSLLPKRFGPNLLRRQEGLRLKYDGETLIVEFDRGKEPVELGRLSVAGKTATEVHDRLSALLKLHKLRRGPVDLVFLGGLLLNRDVELPVEVAGEVVEFLP